MTTSDPSQQNDMNKSPGTSVADASAAKSNSGAPQRLNAIRDQNPSSGSHASAARPTSAATAHDGAGDSTSKLAEAVSRLCDAVDTIVREIPKGAQAQLSSVKDKLSQAREALKACGSNCASTSKDASGSKDASSDVRRAEGEGMTANKGPQSTPA